MDPVTGVGGSGVEPFAAVEAIFYTGGSIWLSVVDERAVLGVDVWVDRLCPQMWVRVFDFRTDDSWTLMSKSYTV